MALRLSPPRRMPNEDTDAYLQRVEAFLVDMAKALSEGVVVGGDPTRLATQGTLAYFSIDPEGLGRGAGLYFYHDGKWLKG